MKRRLTITFRCDASSTIGYGHLVRCMALADEVQEAYDCRTIFLVHPNHEALGKLAKTSHECVLIPAFCGQEHYSNFLKTILGSVQADALVVDVRDDLSRETLESVKQEGICIAIIDDGRERRLAADIAFYPPVPQVKNLDWNTFQGKVYCGWDWVILRKQFALIPTQQTNLIPNVAVLMGGSDSEGLTLKAVAALNEYEDEVTITVVIGPGFSRKRELNELLEHGRHPTNILENVMDMVSIMRRSDVALVAFGVTAYELAACGIPAIHICLQEDDELSSSIFRECGIAQPLRVDDLSNKTICDLVSAIINDKHTIKDNCKKMTSVLDANGVVRISRTLVNFIRGNYRCHKSS